MSNSSLVSYKQISPNRTSPRNNKILKITPHHMAGNMTLAGFGALVAQSSRQMSANYAIDSNGNIGLFCEEKDRSWCSSSPSNDHQAITIEVANDGGAPDWHISDKALNALVDLCTDICQRNDIPNLNFTGDAKGNLTQHNYFVATACPGSYLKSKFSWLANEVNKRLSSQEVKIIGSPVSRNTLVDQIEVVASDLIARSRPENNTNVILGVVKPGYYNILDTKDMQSESSNGLFYYKLEETSPVLWVEDNNKLAFLPANVIPTPDDKDKQIAELQKENAAYNAALTTIYELSGAAIK